MKYDGKVERKVEDSVDVIVNGILHILFAPLNLTREISNRILFLSKSSLQRLSNVMMIIQGVFILSDLFKILRTKQVLFMEGSPSLAVKGMVFISSIFVINWVIDRATEIDDPNSVIAGLEFDDSDDIELEEQTINLVPEPSTEIKFDEFELENLLNSPDVLGNLTEIPRDLIKDDKKERVVFSLDDDELSDDLSTLDFLYGLETDNK